MVNNINYLIFGVFILNGNDIRNIVRLYRKNISLKLRYNSAIQISNIGLEINLIHKAKNIGIFLSFDGEINTYPLIFKLWLKNKNIFLPVIHNLERRQLLFYQFYPNSILTVNLFGILEPKIKKDAFSIEKLDVLFVPLVAFDNKGNRLGMGKGFYDKTLDFSRKKIISIGIAYDFQFFYKIPINSWDKSLFSVLTPKKYIIF